MSCDLREPYLVSNIAKIIDTLTIKFEGCYYVIGCEFLGGGALCRMNYKISPKIIEYARSWTYGVQQYFKDAIREFIEKEHIGTIEPIEVDYKQTLRHFITVRDSEPAIKQVADAVERNKCLRS